MTPATIPSPSASGGARCPMVSMDCCWTVPLLAACANFLFTMPETNSGLFYVFFMDKFGVNREAVSWPRTISTVMSNLMGFVIGAVQQKASIYSMIVTGAILCPAAIIASAFAPNIQWMMLTFGFFYGISEGTLMITTSVYMVSYFSKYRSAAMGLKFLGVSISGVVGPLLLSALDEKYGLGGMFLVLGGLTLNILPLAVLLRNPRPVKVPLRNICMKRAVNDQEPTKCAVPFTEHTQFGRLNERTKERNVPAAQQTTSLYTVTLPTTIMSNSSDNAHPESRRPGRDTQASNDQDDQDGATGFFLEAVNVVKAPVFYALLVPIVAAEFTLPLFASTIVDYAGDKKVSKRSAALLVTYLCTGGFIGRLVIPLLSDKVPHGRCIVASASLLLVSGCFMLMPHLHTFPAIVVVTVITGIQQGYLATIKAVLTADYLGVRCVPVCWGLVAFVSLPLSFFEPSLVGLFRDKGGSYDNLYRLCGAIDLMAAFLLLVKSCIARRGKTS